MNEAIKIIFDGMDNCGKGTQINKLKPYLYNYPIHILHYTNFPGINNKEDCIKYSYNVFKQSISFLNTNNKTNIIYDRSYLDEYIYGQLYRKYTKEEAINQINVEKLLNIDNNLYLIILVDSDINALRKREDNKSQSKAEENLLKKEYQLFKEVYDLSNIKQKIFIDIKNKSIELVHKEIKQFLNLKESDKIYE